MKDRELEIPDKTPFANCKLNREIYANALTSITETYSDGFVLAVDGKWGSGKTTFMKMWRQSLCNKDYKTIYFNAWENDFTSEPMVAIMGEIRSVTNEEDRSTLDGILEKGQKFCTAIIPTLAKVATSLSGMGGIADLVEKVVETMLQTIDTEIKEYENKKSGLVEFRAELSRFIIEKNGGKPIVFIVDELDRCRPDYAVEVLEKIKHLFAVDGIVFVLSIDKEQLGNAIRGYYGSDRIDADEYLRRFIDLEYTLPAPNYEDFCRYLYDKMRYGDFLENRERLRYTELQFNSDAFYKIMPHYCKSNNIPLRHIEKLFIHARIVLKMLPYNGYVHLHIIFFLIIIKESNAELYNLLKAVQKDHIVIGRKLEDMMQEYLLPDESGEDTTDFYFATVFTLITKFYSMDFTRRHRMSTSNIMEKLTDGSYSFCTELKHADAYKVSEILELRGSQYTMSLSSILNKIDLLDPLVS